VSDAKAQQVANDPVTTLFRERSKATAPGSAKEVWIGVDTHKDVNVAAAVDESGRTIGGDQPASISASTTPEGNSDLLAWARGLGETVVAFAVEGTGSYGASLTRFLQGKSQIVVEATRPKREDKAVRRTLGKSDAIDALLAAQRLHRLELRISPKSRVGDVECLRMLRVARKTAVKARTHAINSMKALVVTAPDDLREQLSGLTKDTLPDKCASFRPKGYTPDAAAKTALRSLARRIHALEDEIKALDTEMAAIIKKAAPKLLARQGVGTDVAAALLVTAGDNPDRMKNESSFAAMAGVSPLPDGSGKTDGRHRLNTGGNRDANNALWRIVLTRMNHDPRTKAYVARRTLEGKDKKFIMRALKRYVAREIYAALMADQPGLPAHSSPAPAVTPDLA
jgi:transposase